MSRLCLSPDWIPISAFLILVLTIAGGCDFQRTVEIDGPDHSPKLVVNSEIRPGQPWRVDVSKSIGAFQSGEPEDSTSTVSDATVTVYQNDQRQGTLSLDSRRQYSTQRFTPKRGTEYTVRVTAPDLGTVEATDRVPHMPPAQLGAQEIEGRDTNFDRALQLTINDPADTTNYYHIALQQNGYYRDSTSIDTTGVSDVRFQTRDRSIINEMSGEFELGEQNSYQGREATFRDPLFNGTQQRIELRVFDRVYFSNRDEARIEYVLYLSAVSKDLYQFLRTRRLHDGTEENPFAEPVEVHSNVEGGYGIVGARVVDTLRVEVEVK